MIFYGSSKFQEKMSVLVSRLHGRIRTVPQTVQERVSTLDALRTVLIEAGQLEQTVLDALESLPDSEEAQRMKDGIQTLTDAAALAFCRCWMRFNNRSTGGERAEAEELEELAAGIVALTHACEEVTIDHDICLTVNIPEGFAFYTLYPEAYSVAGQQWAQDHASKNERPVLVVGLRSIGTTLSAVVMTMLLLAGWTVRRVTVRPTGPPFDRQAVVEPASVADVGWALVVDEGPGMSGSSMAAAAEALTLAGLPGDAICFLPGHAGEPGAAANATVRHWWERVPRYVAPLKDLRWRHDGLVNLLAARTSALAESEARVIQVDDIGGGEWRRMLYGASELWPAVCPAFERAKYLCHLESGAAILWKFAGLAITSTGGTQAEADFVRLSRLAQAGWTPAPLGIAFGFIAVPWLSAMPLTQDDSSVPVLGCIGQYLAAAAGPSLPPDEQRDALERLGEMLYWNVWEALGEEVAAQTKTWTAAAMRHAGEGAQASYGDGRLAPCEWLRTGDGRLWKVDCAGHETDHSLIGRQGVGWDVAGAMVEWGLDRTTAQPLFAAFMAAGNVLPPSDLLTFNCLAYAAFRLGQMTLCADMLAHASVEQARCWEAARKYRQVLLQLLPGSPDRSDT